MGGWQTTPCINSPCITWICMQKTGNETHLQEGLRFYEQLRQTFPDRDDFLDSSWFRPALVPLWPWRQGENTAGLCPARGTCSSSGLTVPCISPPSSGWVVCRRIWGKPRKRTSFFHQIVTTHPYDYYAIRARMHLQRGPQAYQEFHPDTTRKRHYDRPLLQANAMTAPWPVTLAIIGACARPCSLASMRRCCNPMWRQRPGSFPRRAWKRCRSTS